VKYHWHVPQRLLFPRTLTKVYASDGFKCVRSWHSGAVYQDKKSHNFVGTLIGPQSNVQPEGLAAATGFFSSTKNQGTKASTF